jgi:antitoxin Phd
MREIELLDAKAKLVAVVDDAVRGESAIITQHGRRQAVIISFKEWERLSQSPLGRLLMSASVSQNDLPTRNRAPVRATDL